MWSALATLASAGVGAAASIYGAREQAKSAERINALNKEYQDEANRLSMELANSAHQREVADLRAANLNPILSAGGSGASTPQIGAVQAENPYSGFGNSASSVGRLVASAGRDFANYISEKYKLDNASQREDILNKVAERGFLESRSALYGRAAQLLDQFFNSKDKANSALTTLLDEGGTGFFDFLNKLHDYNIEANEKYHPEMNKSGYGLEFNPKTGRYQKK